MGALGWEGVTCKTPAPSGHAHELISSACKPHRQGRAVVSVVQHATAQKGFQVGKGVTPLTSPCRSHAQLCLQSTQTCRHCG